MGDFVRLRVGCGLAEEGVLAVVRSVTTTGRYVVLLWCKPPLSFLSVDEADLELVCPVSEVEGRVSGVSSVKEDFDPELDLVALLQGYPLWTTVLWSPLLGTVELAGVSSDPEAPYPIRVVCKNGASYRFTRTGVFVSGVGGICTLWPSKDVWSWRNWEVKRWRASKQGSYWFVGSYGDVLEGMDEYDTMDNGRWVIGNYFPTREAAEAVLSRLKKCFTDLEVGE